MEDINADDDHSENRDPYGDIEIGSPVLDDETSGGQIISQDNGVLKKVIPSSCETMIRVSYGNEIC